MKILISGGKGQLGSDVSNLLGGEHQVTSCSSRELDIADKEMVESVLAREQPELLINCAAYTAVDNCEKEQKLAWSVNAHGH
ncbi:MAG: sugar nucleotide-binding protein [Thermodesulfobacteriota bacterium]